MKLKRGTCYLVNGKKVWIEIDQGGDCVLVCDTETRKLEDNFFFVVREELKPVVKCQKSKTVTYLNQKKELDIFYESQDIPDRCENCNRKLKAFNKFAKRSVTAHILPKAEEDFPEVATHPDNIMFLGSSLFSDCNCHNLWDGLDAAQRKKMRIYPVALERVKHFIDLIPEDKLNKVYKYLGVGTI